MRRKPSASHCVKSRRAGIQAGQRSIPLRRDAGDDFGSGRIILQIDFDARVGDARRSGFIAVDLQRHQFQFVAEQHQRSGRRLRIALQRQPAGDDRRRRVECEVEVDVGDGPGQRLVVSATDGLWRFRAVRMRGSCGESVGYR